MKKFILILIISTLSTQLKSLDSLELYFNPNYCSSCNSIGVDLKRIKQTIITFYLPKQDSAIADELFENYNIDKNLFTLKYLPNNYFPQKTQYSFHSFAILKKENRLNDTFYLKNLHNNIYKFGNSNVKKIIYSNDIKLSSGVRFSVYNNNIIITDNTLNKVIVLQNSNSVVKKIIELKSKDLNVQDFLNCNCINTQMFKFLEPVLNQVGRGKPQINKAYINNNSLYVYYSLGSPIKNPHNTDTTVQFKGFIKSINLTNNQTELTCIKNDGLHEQGLINGKSHTTNEFFIINNDKIMVPCVSPNNEAKNLFINYVKSGSNYINETPSIDLTKILPKEFELNYKNKSFLPRKMNNQFYYLAKFPLIFDYTNNKYVVLNNTDLLSKCKNDAIICDVKEDKSNFIALVYYNNKLTIETYDKLSFKLNNTKNIEYSSTYLEPMFFGNNEIINFTANGFDLIEY